MTNDLQSKSAWAIELEKMYGAGNYNPLPVVLSKGKGVHVWDVEGKRYYDFLSAYSAVNQGHCHPRIVDALSVQANQLTLTSRAFYNDKLSLYEAFVTKTFGYDKVLPMNTGAEAVETAIKICRKYAYEKLGIPDGEARIIVCGNNFHGRTTTIISFSSDEMACDGFGPYTPGFISIPYNDTKALEKALKMPNIAGFLVEPIQGEAGVLVPDEGYLKSSRELCEKHGVLFIADEVQTGIARTGKMLACDYEDIHPDMIILGKALSGGVYPVSAVLTSDAIMEVLKPGHHGSTFGGNPIAAVVAIEALSVIKDEKLDENAFEMGNYFRKCMSEVISNSSLISLIRGKGLLNAIVIDDTTTDSSTAWNICLKMKNEGLLAKPTHGNIIRFAPPLVIDKTQIDECVNIIERSIKSFE